MSARRVALAALLAAAAACGTEVRSGTVTVSLAGPQPPRGLIFRAIGAHAGTVSVPAGQPFSAYAVESGDTLTVVVVAQQGSTLSGAIASIDVPDTHAPPTVAILQVTAPNYVLQSPADYSLSVSASGN